MNDDFNKWNIRKIQVKTALNKIKKRQLPYCWDLNIYRGCMHGCKYCYALYSHEYLTSDDFFSTVFYKENIIEVLEKELRSKKWSGETVNLGGVTDSYQPIEGKLKIMPEILKLFIKYENPINIATKSSLILRDFDLIKKLSEVAYVNVAVSVTTTDENLRKKIEPYSSPTKERFRVLKEFDKINISKGVLLMPIIPLFTDNMDNMESIFANSKESNAQYLIPGYLYLRKKTREVFMDFLRREFPGIFDDFRSLYPGGRVNSDYKENFYRKFKKLVGKYKLTSNYEAPKKKKPPQQLRLFQ